MEVYDAHRMTHFETFYSSTDFPARDSGSSRVDDTILCPKCLLLKIHRDAEFRTIYLM